MTINYNIFNNLNNLRYSMTVSVNGNNYKLNESGTSALWELDLYITYQQLIDELHKTLCVTDDFTNLQQYRNHLSTLHGFMTSVGKAEVDRIGFEFKSGFLDSMNNYLRNLSVTEGTKSDRRTHLKKWLSIFELLTGIAQNSFKPLLGNFNLVLKQSLIDANITQADLVRQAKIPKSVLSQWIRGAKPNSRTKASIHRAEAVLNLKRDALTNLLLEDKQADTTNKPRNIEFRQRLAELAKQPYGLKDEEITNQLVEEWLEYFAYKTSECIDLARTKRGVWRLRPIDNQAKLSPHACKGSEGSVTANMVWDQLVGFLGFLRLPKINGGFGLQVSEVQTLAWYANAHAVQAYLEFIKNRSAGLRHGTHKRIAVGVISLTAPVTGYLWQQAEFLEKIPEHLRPKINSDWVAMCAKANEVARKWKTSSVEKSRRPEEPIAPLLALEYPLEPLLRAVKQLDCEAAAQPQGGIAQARLKRDALLLAFLISNPLRMLNLQIMKWSEDGSKHLYKTADNKLRIRFSGSEMKTKKPYDVKVAQWLVGRIQEYLEDYRDVLLEGASSDYLFISFTKKAEKKIWGGMNSHVAKLTKRLIPETLGFGPHAIRHLVATDWLRKYSNDYITVACLLNDKLETVINNYAHLKQDDSFERYESYMLTLINGSGHQI